MSDSNLTPIDMVVILAVVAFLGTAIGELL